MGVRLSKATQQITAILCVLILTQYQSFAWQQQPAASDGQQKTVLAAEQLDSVVAPVALYPDQLLSQVLVASTYPLEIVECRRWFDQHSNLQGKDLKNAVAKESWDASVQALVAFPDVLKRLDENINWTTDLGNAFLAQQPDVMAAVQRLRQKAQQSGKLQSTSEQKVTTSKENNTTYIEIQPSNPQVIYVPQYDPVVVWGAPPAYYPYPPIVYPPVSTGAVVAAGAIAFGTGLAIGAIWGGGGGWGWNCGWGHNNVVVNNNFIRNNNFNRVNVNSNNAWQHNAAHRGGVPYADRNVANRYNNAGNQNRANRPTANQTQQRLNQADRQMGDRQIGQGRNEGLGQRNEGMGQRNEGVGQRNEGMGQRNQGAADRNQGMNQNANRDFGGRASGAGGGERIGNRDIGGGGFGGGHSSFGDMNQGSRGAQMNRSRGSGSFGGGGGSRGRRR